jgi:hypothetical protein
MKPTCPHIWTRINQTLKQCQGCGVLRTMKPRTTQPRRERDEADLAGDTIGLREIIETYGVCESTVLKAYKQGWIYRVSRGHYDRKSVEGYFRELRDYRVDSRSAISFGPTRGIRVLPKKIGFKG